MNFWEGAKISRGGGKFSPPAPPKKSAYDLYDSLDIAEVMPSGMVFHSWVQPHQAI